MAQPLGDLVEVRLQQFAGFVQSAAPVPPFDLMLNGMRQAFLKRHDAEDPNAPPERRYTAFWNVYCETARVMSPQSRITLEIRVGDQAVAERRFRCELAESRAGTGGPLVFAMHIPKTAGTSLRAALDRHPSLRMLPVYNNSAYLSLDQYRSFAPDALDDLDVVIGHFRYGFHEVTARPFKYVTLLRRPAAFMRSFYLFNKQGNRRSMAAYATLEDAIEHSGHNAFDNYFTRFLSGKAGHGPATDDDFTRAATNMRRDFAFVGDADDMRGAMASIGTLLGLPLDVAHENATPATSEAPAIDLAAIEARFHARLRYDEQLCAVAKEHFDRAKIAGLPPLLSPRSPGVKRKRLLNLIWPGA